MKAILNFTAVRGTVCSFPLLALEMDGRMDGSWTREISSLSLSLSLSHFMCVSLQFLEVTESQNWRTEIAFKSVPHFCLHLHFSTLSAEAALNSRGSDNWEVQVVVPLSNRSIALLCAILYSPSHTLTSPVGRNTIFFFFFSFFFFKWLPFQSYIDGPQFKALWKNVNLFLFGRHRSGRDGFEFECVKDLRCREREAEKEMNGHSISHDKTIISSQIRTVHTTIVSFYFFFFFLLLDWNFYYFVRWIERRRWEEKENETLMCACVFLGVVSKKKKGRHKQKSIKWKRGATPTLSLSAPPHYTQFNSAHNTQS